LPSPAKAIGLPPELAERKLESGSEECLSDGVHLLIGDKNGAYYYTMDLPMAAVPHRIPEKKG